MNSYERLEQALRDFFSDKSNTPEETKDGLNTIISEAEILLDTLD